MKPEYVCQLHFIVWTLLLISGCSQPLPTDEHPSLLAMLEEADSVGDYYNFNDYVLQHRSPEYVRQLSQYVRDENAPPCKRHVAFGALIVMAVDPPVSAAKLGRQTGLAQWLPEYAVVDDTGVFGIKPLAIFTPSDDDDDSGGVFLLCYPIPYAESGRCGMWALSIRTREQVLPAQVWQAICGHQKWYEHTVVVDAIYFLDNDGGTIIADHRYYKFKINGDDFGWYPVKTNDKH